MLRLTKSQFGRRVAGGVFWSFVGTAVARVASLLSSVCIARIVGKTVYGQLGVVQSTIGMFGVFAGLGLGLTATKYVSELRNKDIERASRIAALSLWVAFLSGLFIAISLFAAAPWLAKHSLAAPALAVPLQLSAPILFLNALNGTQIGILAGLEAFRGIAKANLWAGIITVPFTVGGALYGSLDGIIVGLVVGIAAGTVVTHFYLRRYAARSGLVCLRRPDWCDMHVIWFYSIPAVLGSVLVGPITWICNAILVNEPNGYSEMGIYSAANQWFTALQFLPGVLGQALLPLLSERLGSGDHRGSRRVLAFSVAFVACVVVPLAALGCIWSTNIMSMYGPSFKDGGATLDVVLFTAALLAIQAPIGITIAASARMWTGMLMNLGWAAVMVGCAYLLRRHGAYGLASARALAYVVHASWTFGFAIYIMKYASPARQQFSHSTA